MSSISSLFMKALPTDRPTTRPTDRGNDRRTHRLIEMTSALIKMPERGGSDLALIEKTQLSSSRLVKRNLKSVSVEQE